MNAALASDARTAIEPFLDRRTSPQAEGRNRPAACVCIALSTLLLAASPSLATNHYVSLDSPNPMPPYTNRATATPFIQHAVDVATDGDEVIVAEGTYTGLGNKNIDFQGKNITVRSETGPEETIIDCELEGRGFNFHSGETLRARLEGITIQNGSERKGCSIYVVNSSPALVDCIFREGSGLAAHGAVFCDNGSPEIVNCVFMNNHLEHGSGITCENGGDVKIEGCEFYGGTSSAIYCQYGTKVTVERCLITGIQGTADHHAPPAIYLVETDEASVISNCLIANNRSSRWAAGIWLIRCRPTILNCTIVGNQSEGPGGGIGCYEAFPTILNTIIWGNESPGDPQVVLMAGSVPTITYSDIQGDWAGEGNIAADPDFVDAPDNNFRLGSSSACLNACDPSYIPAYGTTDLDGNRRINGGIVDMGAYEFQLTTGVRYVKINNPTPSPPYTSWATAATNIQDAVDAADAGDTVMVTNGVYAAGGKVVDGSTNRVAVDKPLSLLSVNGPEATIIDGLGSIRCAYLTNGVTLSGFSLRNGWADRGGGVFCTSVTTVVSNCVLAGNAAQGYPRVGGGAGGGAFGGTLIHCTLANNSVSWGRGGGASHGTLSACVLRGNAASGGRGAGGSGGGVYESTLTNCTLTGNSAVSGGGAAGSTLHHCTLSGNSASGAVPWVNGGGAILSTLSHCILSGNSSDRWCGGASWSTLSNCTLTGNNAVFVGGAQYGTLVNCTVVGNSASEAVGGVSAVNLTNCIVYFNSSPREPNYSPGTPAHYTCTTPLPTHGAGNITDAPRFLDTNDWSSVRLQPDSPGIDAGNNDSVTTPTDLDGNPRIRSGTVDMGAYEFQAPPDTHYVNINNPTPSPPYRSWDTAATNIQNAVGAADAGDTVLVTNGVYSTGGTVVDGSSNRVTVDKLLSLLSVNGPEQTIIDGLGFVRCVYLNNGATLSGFTLTNGSADRGGGVLCESETAVVSNCVLVGNRVGNPADYDSRINLGGGAHGGSLNNCLLADNIAHGSSRRRSGLGGGAYGSTLNTCMLIGNRASAGGGAAYSTLNVCTLTSNHASSGGGAHYSTLGECVLMHNTASGGGRWSKGGAVSGSTLSHCILASNSTEGNGGGAYFSTLSNCMVTGNSAFLAGGVASGTLISCTVVGNSASEAIGGVAGGYVTNCIVYFNAAPVNANHHGQPATFSYTCTTPLLSNGVGNISDVPRFVDTNSWIDLRLRPNSPCIDAGNNDFVTTLTDLDGNPRIWGGVVDMGAYEFVPLTPAEAIEHLISLINGSDLHHKRPLLASLEAALASIERGNDNSATGQLEAFQNKVSAQVYKNDSVLAMELMKGAGQAIDELDDSPKMAGKIHSLKRHPNGRMQMEIKGEAGQTYILEASTNLVDWEAICVVSPDEDGGYRFEDAHEGRFPCRFYRVVEP